MDLYPAAGAADDWMYDKVVTGKDRTSKGLVYTLELRPSSNDPAGFVLPV